MPHFDGPNLESLARMLVVTLTRMAPNGQPHDSCMEQNLDRKHNTKQRASNTVRQCPRLVSATHGTKRACMSMCVWGYDHRVALESVHHSTLSERQHVEGLQLELCTVAAAHTAPGCCCPP